MANQELVMFPGAGLLADAFTAIGTLICDYIPWKTRSLNDVGQWISLYGTASQVEISLQAVEREMYVEMGLDLQKNYVMIYANIDAENIDRNVTGDRFKLPDGKIYQIESLTSWFLMDGWMSALCIKVEIP